jgi:hypothetical protein
MREPRNPFRLRASEHIESDETFVRLFSPEMLDMLSTPAIWERPQIIRSAPGGGKTSLMRLFTPSSLRTIYGLRTREYTKDLFKSLSGVGAMDDNGPCVLGVFLSCGHSFATLEDLDLDDGRKQRLFLSLLNARIMLAVLHGILDLKQMEYPNQLNRISLSRENHRAPLPDTPSGLTGEALYSWAEGLERTVCEALDSFLPLSESPLPGHDSLLVLSLINATGLLVDGVPVTRRVLVMLDDVHRLTFKQREWLLDAILSVRSAVAIWVAERLQALTVEELLSSGAAQGRDYGEVVTIEDYWRGARIGKFEKLMSSVADRRTRDARDVEIGRFADCLQDSLDGDEWHAIYREGIPVIVKRVKQKAAGHQKFSAWISEREKTSGTPRELLLSWRTLEILVERELRKSQQTFDFELEAADLEQREVSSVRAAAELFVARELGLPYYYGLPRLAGLASSNIEQFLRLSGDIFEECVSAALLRRPTQLTPSDQERILRKAIRNVWKELPRQVKHGTQVIRLLEAIGRLGQWETHKPNAPYAPGVTGIAISMADRATLKDALARSSGKHFALLGEVIASCIAHNLLEANLNQKCKGQYWMVLYLNRMLCVHFDLPLQYGGWRERRLSDLVDWLGKGFTPPSDRSGLFA